MKAYLQFGGAALGLPNGPFLTEEVPHKEKPLAVHGYSQGYGRHIPTIHMIKWCNRWRRVYACQISNAGTLYIGKSTAWEATVDLWES